MPARSGNLYQCLGIDRRCSFTALKKAYYRRAKECHPDRFQGDCGKEEEFKRLVSAFDILSDPLRRREYDEQLDVQGAAAGIGFRSSVTEAEVALYPRDGASIMDSVADDILEELIVGNDLPRHTTLQTLMRDLEQTTRFVTFREAKTLYFTGHYQGAYDLLNRAVSASPRNILYHYYFAECSVVLRHFGRARKHYRRCLQIGVDRGPPQRLDNIRRRLQEIRRRSGLIGRVAAWFHPVPAPAALPVEETMRRQLGAQMTRLIRDRHDARERSRPTPLLDDGRRHSGRRPGTASKGEP